MKKIILLLLFTNICIAQHHFKIENEAVIWQKVFETDSTNTVAIFKKLKGLKQTNKLDFSVNNKIQGETVYTSVKLSNPAHWAGWPYKCFLNIEFKKNRLRVTASDFTFDGPTINIYGVESKLDYIMTKGAVKRGKFKTNKKTIATLNDFEIHLIDLFTISENKEEDNW